jgi:hypothetical protein
MIFNSNQIDPVKTKKDPQEKKKTMAKYLEIYLLTDPWIEAFDWTNFV